MILGFAWLALGLYAVCYGVYIYVVRGAEHRIRDGYAFRTGLVVRSGMYGLVPGGLAVVCLGLATIVTANPISDWFMGAGVILLCLAIVAMVWHPNWIRPGWAREPKDRRI
jgi:hypothetical protein